MSQIEFLMRILFPVGYLNRIQKVKECEEKLFENNFEQTATRRENHNVLPHLSSRSQTLILDLSRTTNKGPVVETTPFSYTQPRFDVFICNQQKSFEDPMVLS